jgi:hypothetical protein
MESPPPAVNATALFLNQAAISDFGCAICLNVAMDVVQCVNGHLYCRSCLEQALTTTEKCPSCNVTIASVLISNLAVKKLINAQAVYCYTRLEALEAAGQSTSSASSCSSCSATARNIEKDVDHCTWQGRLEEAVSHFNECGYAVVKCSFAGCDEMVVRRDKAEHETTCEHCTEPCGLCGQHSKNDDLALHQLVCPRRQVDCDNDGCDARVALDELAAHKANDCACEMVDCPFADVGCTARMLRKDIDSHEDAALKQHNRLLLGKVKAQQQVLQRVERAHEELREDHELLKLGLQVITLRVKHAVLTGREPFVPQYPSHPTRVYSLVKMVQRHKVSIYVQTKNINPEDQDHYGVLLEVSDGAFPCRAIFAFELVHHDGNPQSAVKDEVESIFAEAGARGFSRFIRKAELASADNNPYVHDGYVTFKCTLKVVNE